jgi:hypothetical protein
MISASFFARPIFFELNLTRQRVSDDIITPYSIRINS